MLTSVLFSAFLLVLAAAAPGPQSKRQEAQVVYGCTVPNTVALTFVRLFVAAVPLLSGG